MDFTDLLAHDLTRCTATEIRLVRALFPPGSWRYHDVVIREAFGAEYCDPDVYRSSIHNIRVHVHRLRKKLATTRVRIESRPQKYGAYRLVILDDAQQRGAA